MMAQRFVFISLFILLLSPSAMALVECSSGAIDSDNDGYGWENSRSCKMTRVVSTARSFCQNPGSDPDGDGWGWEDDRSCRMSQGNEGTIQEEGINGGASLSNESVLCEFSWSDPDGDGWGWENDRSCRMSQGSEGTTQEETFNSEASSGNEGVPCEYSWSDPDGDGWGWENDRSCIASKESSNNSQNSSQFHNGSDDSLQWSDLLKITDIVVTAGQSNATGNNTKFDLNHPKDRLNSRIYVWTTKGWKIANPTTQLWSHRFYNPALSRNDGGNLPMRRGESHSNNHPAFQIARAMVQKNSERVVAIIPTSMSGASIRYWVDEGESSLAFQMIKSSVNDALGQLPDSIRNNKVSLFWWMQGEADDLRGDSKGSYPEKFARFQGQLENQYWYGANTLLFANTVAPQFNVNSFFRGLDNDFDSNTYFIDNRDYVNQTLPGDSVHFNANALRKIGDLVAEKYEQLR